MFRQFVQGLVNLDTSDPTKTIAMKQRDAAEKLFALHPVELMALLDLAWARSKEAPPPSGLGQGMGIPALPQARAIIESGSLTVNQIAAFMFCPEFVGRWDHLIYAYMIENTRIYEIFRRVMHEFLHGEKFGQPSQITHNWVRNTEELFYRDPPPFFISTITSHIRRDMCGSRRNAYDRMFGMDLNHGTNDGKPYPYIKADARNSDFVASFEEFLREVWIGMTNFDNQIGTNPIDDAKIADLAERLFGMLNTRRQNGSISREEFVYVSMMSWFHLTVETNNQVIFDLRANATNPEQELFKVAERVGLPAHGLSRNFFEIANPISRILTQIETGIFNDRAALPALYIPSPGNSPEKDMRNIIYHWSIITGRDIKSRKVALT